MALLSGARVGPYEILAAIGAGGMGEVYRARDTKLDREVAIKILPELFAADPERVARFEREAKTLAALNHPHIAQIYGFEETQPSAASTGSGPAGSGRSGQRALVMELVEGPTLADRIAQGPIPVAEALPIAKQIAEALEAAHEIGIIHRDLKPANVIVQGAWGPTPARGKTAASSVDSPPRVSDDVVVKVLDFGLAKALEPTGSGVDGAALTNSPTITSPAAMPRLRQGYGEAGTMPGVILGTAAYMAPEQAKGRAVDKRADIWAFGCVLFEMVTGQRAFPGDDVSDTLAAVLRGEPDWAKLPADTPAAISRLLRRCLEKDRKRRLDSIADAWLEIDDALAGPSDQPTTVAAPSRTARRQRLAWTVAVLSLVLVAAVAALLPAVVAHWHEPPVNPPVARFPVVLPDGVRLAGGMALSPDGKYLALTGADSKGNRIWVRPLDGLTAGPVPGTEGAVSTPVWSPDSQNLAFAVSTPSTQLRRVALRGSGAQTICDLTRIVGSGVGVTAAWSAADLIIFSASTRSGLFRVSATGGDPAALTDLRPGEAGHVRPDFLPDGEHFIFASNPMTAEGPVYVGSTANHDRTLLLRSRLGARYVAPDRVVFVRGQTILAQRFDPATFSLVGAPTVLADNASSGNPGVTVSQTGALAYQSGDLAAQFTIVGRDGKLVATVGDPGLFYTMSMARDERRIAYGRRDAQGSTNIWITDLVRNTSTRLTFGDGTSADTAWSPDGKEISFVGDLEGRQGIYTVPSTGGAERLLLASSGRRLSVDDWSRDGRFLLYKLDAPSAALMALPLAGNRTPFLVFRPAAGNVDESTFSPDGRWIAYNATESGRSEIYVRRFPPTDDKWQISAEGGMQPRWRGDGRELFYLAPNGTMMAVGIQAGDGIDSGRPRALFDTSLMPSSSVDQYVVNAAGDRFVMMQPIAGQSAVTVNAVVNWPTLMTR